MKATGIVRRMDDLGRVVIPKEIRRTMKIGEGTPLEIFIDKDGGIIFRKYSPVGGLRTADAAFPILSQGDVCGMFMLIKGEDSHPGEPEDSLRLAKLAASFLGRETVQ